MKVKHILIFATIFILSIGLGLFGPVAYEKIKELIKTEQPEGNDGGGGEVLPPSELNVTLIKKKYNPKLVVTEIDYSYKFEASVTPKGTYTYTLSDGYGHTYTSDDGKFKGVEANADGSYNLVVFDPKNNAKSQPITVTGFKVKKKITKITTSYVTATVRKGDFAKNGSKIKSKMASGCKIYRSGGLTTLQEIFISADMGNSPTAKSIKYNYLNQVTRIDF